MTGERLVTIQGPDVLSPGQNFFDQDPFQRIISGAAAVTSNREFDEIILRRSLAAIANSDLLKGLRDVTNDSTLISRLRYHMRHLSKIAFSSAYFKLPHEEVPLESYTASLESVLTTLEEDYPYWLEYVSTNFDFYTYEGKPRNGTRKSAQTYSGWLAQKIRVDDPYYELETVLDEAFPGSVRRSLIVTQKTRTEDQ